MSNLNSASEQYHLTHSNFVEAYRMVNEYVTELYRLPKQFIDETEGAINAASAKHFTPKSPSSTDKSMRVVIDFMDQLDSFTMHTINLFNEHMKHIEATEVYMKKVILLDTQSKPAELAGEYSSLLPEVNRLMDGLKDIKLKADDTLDWLEKLEVNWSDVQVKIKNAA
jgi:hypothetical protein